MKHVIEIKVETNSDYGVQCMLRRLSEWQAYNSKRRNVISYVHTKKGKVIAESK